MNKKKKEINNNENLYLKIKKKIKKNFFYFIVS